MRYELVPHVSIGKATWRLLSDEDPSVLVLSIPGVKHCAMNIHYSTAQKRNTVHSDKGVLILPYDVFSSAESAKLYIFDEKATTDYDVPLLHDVTSPPTALTTEDNERLLGLLDRLLIENKLICTRLSNVEKNIFHNSILGL